MFLITNLPAIMRKQGWKTAARCMDRWFSLAPHALSPDEKAGGVALMRLDAQTLATDILTMDWAMSFDRIRDAANDITAGAWNTPAARTVLLARLRGWQAANPTARQPDAVWEFGDLRQSVATIDANLETNYLPVGAVTDPLDDFYGAVGRATLKTAVTGRVTNSKDGHPKSMEVTALGLYLRDTYDFVGDQFLGVWSEQGVNSNRLAELAGWKVGIYPSIAIDADEYAKAVADDRAAFERPITSRFGGVTMPPPRTEGQLADFEDHRWHSVANGDFRRYRARTMKGHDYINVSDVRVTRPARPVVVTF